MPTRRRCTERSRSDSQSLQVFTLELKKRLNTNGFLWRNLLADTGYSSGENYAFLERQGIESYIPPLRHRRVRHEREDDATKEVLRDLPTIKTGITGFAVKEKK
ncbi:MAG TPA: transposase [Bacteroidales bacterium]|nr:transposase [Bacteroidales bacterium]